MKRQLIIGYVLLFAWMAVIFVLSSEGHEASSGRSDAIVGALQAWGVVGPTELLTFLTRKMAHMVAYFVLGGLAFNVLRHYALRLRWQWLASLGIVVLYASSDELHQVFVPGRSGELRDVAIDSVAGAVGVIATWIIYKKYLLYKSQK